MAINGVPAKTDYELFNDEDFIVDGKVTSKHYRNTPARKVNKAFNLVKDEVLKNESAHKRRIRKMRKESVMTPIPNRSNSIRNFNYPSTSTGNANVLVNELSKLLSKNMDNYDAEFNIKVKCNDTETKWMTVNYDVIQVLADVLKDYVD